MASRSRGRWTSTTTCAWGQRRANQWAELAQVVPASTTSGVRELWVMEWSACRNCPAREYPVETGIAKLGRRLGFLLLGCIGGRRKHALLGFWLVQTVR
jgi:hypothetical protein